MKRIYHPYWTWEDFQAGMWNKAPKDKEEAMLKTAIEFTGDHIKYGAAMRRVTKEWPISCENNLTDINQNRKAWLGHAACCLEIRIPEYIIRAAWKQLTEEQRILANEQADFYINEWLNKSESQLRFNYETENNRVYKDMGEEVLS